MRLKHMSVSVVICEDCDGKGYRVEERLVNYHKSEYDYEQIQCMTCNSTGRMWKEENITYKPFK